MMRHDQRGFVSLLTVTLMSVLILLLTLAMTRLMVGELHQATDSADSVKAYYIAQGAAENTAQQLRSYIENGTPTGRATGDLSALNQGCGSNSLYPQPSALADSVTCVEVTTSTTQVSADLGQNQTQSYDLSDAVLTDGGNLTRLVVSWDGTNVAGGGSFTDPGSGAPGGPGVWDVSGSTTGNQPPVMELGITNYFPGQQTNINQTYSGTILLDPRPAGTTGTANSFDYVCYLQNSPTAAEGDSNCPGGATSPVMQVNCTSGLPKRCTATITGLVPVAATGDRTVLTITPLFHDAQFTMSAYATKPTVAGVTCQTDASTGPPNNDCLAPVALQDAQVDVTSTVGQTTRRILLSVPVRSVAALTDVLEGDSDICKSFDILQVGGVYVAGQPNGGDQPTCLINDNLGSYDAESSSAPLTITASGGDCTDNVLGVKGAVEWAGSVSVTGANPGDQLSFRSSPTGPNPSTASANSSGNYSNSNFGINTFVPGVNTTSWNLTVTDVTNPSIPGGSTNASCNL